MKTYTFKDRQHPNQQRKNTMTAQEARAKGYRPLTTKYIKKEQWMLDNVLADMRRGGIDHVLVEQDGGVEVWRTAPHQTANIKGEA
jgi:ATP sulfurylase